MQIDKQAHFWWGMAMTATLSYLIPLWVAFTIAITAGVVKEWYDEYCMAGQADPYDLGATALGAFVAMVWIYLMNLLS